MPPGIVVWLPHIPCHLVGDFDEYRHTTQTTLALAISFGGNGSITVHSSTTAKEKPTCMILAGATFSYVQESLSM